MKIESDENFKDILKQIAKDYSLDLNDTVCNNLNIYKNLLKEWNNKMNLTNITDEYEIIVKHFIDCLQCAKYISKEKKIIDIGTGAGFPGMVLAIYFEDKLDITLMDSLNKRLIFLEEVLKELNLKNVKIEHQRAEDAGANLDYREKYDIVLSRAVAPLNILLEYASGLLKKDGKYILMKGENYESEIENSKNALRVLNTQIENIYKYKLIINNEEYNRVIINCKKNKNLNSIYPRSYGKIKKNPL